MKQTAIQNSRLGRVPSGVEVVIGTGQGRTILYKPEPNLSGLIPRNGRRLTTCGHPRTRLTFWIP